jgi:hypothetical protein
VNLNWGPVLSFAPGLKRHWNRVLLVCCFQYGLTELMMMMMMIFYCSFRNKI